MFNSQAQNSQNYGNYNENNTSQWEEEDEIDLMDFLFIIIRRWKLIIMLALPVVILGLIYALSKPDIYRAESTLMVSSGQIYSAERLENSDISRNQKLVSSYTEVARSKSIMKNVIRKLDMDADPESVANLVKVTPVDETEFIKISYTDENPQMAALMVNEVSRAFMMRIREVMNFENLKIVEAAEIPEKPEGSKRMLIVALSGVLGIMLGVFAAFVAEFFLSNVRKPEELQKIMGCKVLANIPSFDQIGIEEMK